MNRKDNLLGKVAGTIIIAAALPAFGLCQTATPQPTPTPAPAKSESDKKTASPKKTEKQTKPTGKPSPKPSSTVSRAQKSVVLEREGSDTPSPALRPGAVELKPFVSERESRRDKELEATIQVEFTIDTQGKATVELLQGSGNSEVDKAVLAELSKWTWEPATKDGKPVETIVRRAIRVSVGRDDNATPPKSAEGSKSDSPQGSTAPSVTPAEVRSAPEPQIPTNLRSAELEATITVEFTVQVDGHCTVDRISSTGNRQVDEVILSQLRRWTWKPATKNGKPVESYVRRTIRVSIE